MGKAQSKLSNDQLAELQKNTYCKVPPFQTRHRKRQPSEQDALPAWRAPICVSFLHNHSLPLACFLSRQKRTSAMVSPFSLHPNPHHSKLTPATSSGTAASSRIVPLAVSTSKTFRRSTSASSLSAIPTSLQTMSSSRSSSLPLQIPH